MGSLRHFSSGQRSVDLSGLDPAYFLSKKQQNEHVNTKKVIDRPYCLVENRKKIHQ